jgi:predicted nucleic acid-binding protein
MHAEVFLDTNILLYAASRATAERHKRARARDLLGLDAAGLSVQVLAEFYVNASDKLKLPEEKVIKVLEALENYPVLPISESMFWTALAIMRRYQISYWDSAIIAAAAELGCHTLYSEDLSHGQTYNGVRVINPFLD